MQQAVRYFRPNVEAMAGYVPGEQPQGDGYIKLNTNENPYPPPRSVLQAIRAAVNDRLRLYPDPLATDLRRKIAEVYGTRTERVIVGNGSDDILAMLVRAVAGPGRTVAYPVPTYSLYPTLCRIVDAPVREVPYPHDFSLPADRLVRARAALTFVASPNSPSGTVIPPAELGRLARRLRGLLAIDEAYVDFADEHCLHLVERHRNVVVLRSFSKSFSLCGIRLGFAVAREEIVEGLVKVKDSYNVNRLAQVAGVAALEAIGVMRAHAEQIRATRARLVRGLEAFGWRVYPSQANFVFARVRPPATARGIYEALKARRILVRWFDSPGLEDGLRISVGSERETDVLLRELGRLCAPHASRA